MLRALAVVCPPLAVLVASPPRAAANAALTLAFYVPGLLHALWVVDRRETDRRNETLLRLDAMQLV